MDEKNKENKNSNGGFKTVNNSKFPTYSKKVSSNRETHWRKTIFIPFLSGIIGSAVLLGTCFGVPSIRNKILGNSTSSGLSSFQSSSNSKDSNSGYVNQTSLSGYSDTSIYAANKILPSIVGISVEYTVSSNFSFFAATPQSSTAKATGSGIIILLQVLLLKIITKFLKLIRLLLNYIMMKLNMREKLLVKMNRLI